MVQSGESTFFYHFVSLVRAYSNQHPDTILNIYDDLKEACQNHCHHAPLLLSVIHQYGPEDFQDDELVINYLDRAIVLDNYEAMSRKASFYMSGTILNKDVVLAKNLLELAHENLNPSAFYYLGYMHQHGIAYEKNLSAAKKLYKNGRLKNNIWAMDSLALMYENEGRYDKAIALHEQGMKLGSYAAFNNRARLHKLGLGGPVDLDKAAQLLDVAIKLGSVEAFKNKIFYYIPSSSAFFSKAEKEEWSSVRKERKKGKAHVSPSSDERMPLLKGAG